MIKRKSRKKKKDEARSQRAKGAWTPERRAAQGEWMRKYQQNLKERPAEVLIDPEANPGYQECIDWLEQNGVVFEGWSPWYPPSAEPPDDPVELVKYRFVVWSRAADPDAATYRQMMFERCQGTGLTDVAALVYFTKTFIWQKNAALKGREIGPFIPWDYQVAGLKEIMESLLAPNENWEREDLAVEKSRELGATQSLLILCLWICACHRNKRVLPMSHTEKAVKDAADEDTHFGKIEFMLDRMPGWFRRGAFRKGNVIRFPGTASQMNAQATTKRSGVSNRMTLILLDEFSKWRDAEEIWAQLASTGPRLACGTHYGVGNQFHYLTQGAGRIRKVVWHWSQHPVFARGKYRVENGRVEFLDPQYIYPPQCPKCSRIQAKVRVGEPTNCCGLPARDYHFVTDGTPSGGPHIGVRSPWYDRECVRRADPREVASHLDINPQGGVHQVFNELAIFELRRKVKPPLWEGDIEQGALVVRPFGPLKLWTYPNVHGKIPPGRYGAGGDVAQGTGATPSCLAVYDGVLRQRVAAYANAHIDARAFADFAVALCRLFATAEGTGAMLCWELNGPGVQFGNRVLELGYANVYCREEVAPRMYVTKRSDRPGWDSGATGAIQTLIEEYRWAVQSGTLREFDDDTLRETLDYRYNALGIPEHPGKKAKFDPSGSSVNHGDRVTAAAQGWKMVKGFDSGHSDDPEQAEAPAGSWLWRRQMCEAQDRQAETEAWV